MDDCTIDCIQIIGNFSSSGSCTFAREYCVQSTLQVIQGYYCWANGSFGVLLLVSLLGLLLVYFAINTAADNYLVPCLQEFILRLNMSDALAGITFLALANGTPNVITAVAAGASSSPSTLLIPFGSIFGSSMFSMGFILSTIVVNSPTGLTLNLHETLVPLGFYLLGTVYLIVVSLWFQKMNEGLALAFLSLYPIYIIVVLIEERRRRKEAGNDREPDQSVNQKIGDVYQQIIHEEEIQDEEEKEGKRGFFGRLIHLIRMLWMFLFTYTVPVVLKEEWRPTKVVVALLFAPIILYLVKGMPQVFEEEIMGMPYAVWFSIPSFLLLVYSIYCIYRKEKPRFSMVFNLYSFVVIVAWIASIIGVLINLMQLLQLLTQINPIFLGLTVFSWISSIGDYFSITSFARRGYVSTATAGIFSGQLLDFLIGFGLSCLVRAVSNGQYFFDIFVLGESKYEKVSDLIVLMVIGMAFAYMVTLFVTLVLQKGKLQKKNSTFSRIFYVSFVAIGLLMSLTTDFFKEYECILTT